MIHIYKSIMITLLLALVPFVGISAAKKKAQQQSDRQYWCSLAYKMAQPVLENMAKGELQKNMLSVSAETAVQEDGKVGYVQPIGERAISGQTVDANSQANFGVGAMLLTACEYDKYLNTKL